VSAEHPPRKTRSTARAKRKGPLVGLFCFAPEGVCGQAEVRIADRDNVTAHAVAAPKGRGAQRRVTPPGFDQPPQAA